LLIGAALSAVMPPSHVQLITHQELFITHQELSYATAKTIAKTAIAV
jgi:hypothetical protein